MGAPKLLKSQVLWLPLLLILWLLAAADVGLFDFGYIAKSLPHFAKRVAEMIPPDFANFHLLIRPLLQTFQMAILGTLLGALMAIPLVVFGSQVVIRTQLIYLPVRVLMNLIRSIPDLLYAVIFVAAMGLGPIAGVPALAFFSCGIISKLSSESADNINQRQLEAIEAVGARRWQIIQYSVLPQLWPAFLDHVLYVFELNIRISTVAGYVGAGGIGTNIITALEWFQYDQALAVILTIFALVLAMDFVGNRLRDAVLHGVSLPASGKLALGLGILAAVVWSATSLEINPQRVLEGMTYFKNIMLLMITQPTWEFLPYALDRMLESVEIALVGTTLSFLMAAPLGFLASRKHVGVPEPIAILFKQIPNTVRTFPELILAIFFMATFGPIPLAGVLAIAIHSVGMLGKFNAEDVEKIRKEPVEAIQTTGATRLQIFWYGIVPQVLPEFLARALYRFEINVRAASVLGIVGVGGIGSLIIEGLHLRSWGLIGMCLIVVVSVVIVIDLISAYLRKRLIQG